MTHTISWNEIQNRATAFAAEWVGEGREQAESQSFWNDFFAIFGVQRRKVASFERKNAHGRIDLLWPGTLLVEQKSRGKDLSRAYTQALDYFPGLKQQELPRYVLVCDFERFELTDLEPLNSATAITHRLTLAELPTKIHLFAFIAGYQSRKLREADPINQEAVLAIGELHDALKANGYGGAELEVFLVRLLFCLFADDTGIFQPKDSFHDLLEYHSREDGADLGSVLGELFTILNEKREERQKNLAEHFSAFAYVNGKLFQDHYRPPAFNAALRQQLLDLCGLDWGSISPAIFGAMFQTVIALEGSNRRRQLGAHYTSEANIYKLINTLFLDELRAEFERVKKSKNSLFEFHKKLRSLTFLDPACGCGNFLVVAYKALRELEHDVLRAAARFGARTAALFDVLQVNVDQFYGIEIEEFPAQIAQVALWLTDHQMNVAVGSEFGEYVARIPLETSAVIRKGNALEIDWSDFVPPEKLSYIMGNPPFLGKSNQSIEQKKALASVTVGIPSAGVLDFVAGWYIKASQYMSTTPDSFSGMAAKTNIGRKKFTDVRFSGTATSKSIEPKTDLFVDADTLETQRRRAVRCAFVSTNSICQGEQVGVLWGYMLSQGVGIEFAHRTFAWTNDAPGKAAVHCVIVGFGVGGGQGAKVKTQLNTQTRPRLFDYKDIQGDPHEVLVRNINPYLVDAPNAILPTRREPISAPNAMSFGSMPNDGGGFLFSDAEKQAFIKLEPAATKWLKPFLGADEFLNSTPRWCLWLKDCPPQTLKSMKAVVARVAIVHQHRAASSRPTTQELAKTPTLFGEDRQPTARYLLIPGVSSENRSFIPIGFLPATVIASNANLTIPNATLYDFGILSSTQHNAWVRYTCGRLESRYRYSASIVYNNFPWPQNPSDNAKKAIEMAAQKVLDARAQHQEPNLIKEAQTKNKAALLEPASLATLYNPSTMPPNLVAAHKTLDQAVDAAYLECEKNQKQAKPLLKTDTDRVAFLFNLYQRYTSLV